jgi:hypothetical protein
MDKAGPGMDLRQLKEMKRIIDGLGALLDDLNRLGRDMPVIEKNVRAMRSFLAVLGYGISDLAEIKNHLDSSTDWLDLTPK